MDEHQHYATSQITFLLEVYSAALQDPDDDMRLKGSSGTDENHHYVDDGLQQKYEGLHQMRLALNRDLIDMAALIGPASAELGYLKLCRRKTSHYSMGIYRDVNRCSLVFHCLRICRYN